MNVAFGGRLARKSEYGRPSVLRSSKRIGAQSEGPLRERGFEFSKRPLDCKASVTVNGDVNFSL